TEITTLKKTLQQGQPVYFNKVGKLYEDAHNILCFEPDSQYNLLKDSFGLSPIFAQIISKPNTQETAVNISPIKEKESIVPPNKPKATIPVLKIAATMLLLMGLGYVFWLLTSTEINNSNRAFQWADL